MRTWNDYKEHVREVDPIAANNINEIENIASIVNHQLHVLNRINQLQILILCLK